MLLPLLFLLQSSGIVNAALKEVWYNVTYVEGVNPDGLASRRVIGVNGTWPPPPVEITINDTLRVHAINGLDQPTSIHHHGMFFNSTSYYDGAIGVTQCGIPPTKEYTYEVDVNSSGQWGTYWWHAHANGQYVDGLRAPLVIHRNPDLVTNPVAAKFPVTKSSPEAYQYDAEYTVILGDWYHDEHTPLVKHFISQANPGGAEPVPDSALIYFAQNGSYLPPIPGTSGGIGTNNVGFNENSTITFQPGKNYRLRVINTSAFSMFFFWIEGHNMTIIEVDGTDIEGTSIDVLPVTVAQRYSVLVTALNTTSNNYVIHANMDTDMFDKVPDALMPNITSSVTYSAGAPMASGTGQDTTDDYPILEDETYVPLEVASIPDSTVQVALLVSFDTMTDGTNRAMFNDVTFNTPVVPPIFTQYSMGNQSANVAVYGPSSFVLSKNDVVELTVTNGDAGKHPFHLHGHKFAIVNRVGDVTDPTTQADGNVTNPMRRDTIEIPSGGSVTLRWVADNPGAWMFHCHIDWHLSAGLAVVFNEAPLDVHTLPPPPQYAYDACAALGQPTTGNAAGHNSTTDFSGLTFGPYVQNNGWHSKGIGAMAGCVLTAVLGMLSVVWYAYSGGRLTDEEVEERTREKHLAREKSGRFGGLFSKKT